MQVEQFDMVYCEGWDPEARAIAGPIRPAEARRRDDAGEEYAILVLGGSRPRALIEISWRHYSCVVWGFDDNVRRVLKRDFRRLDEQRVLFLVEETEWNYPEPAQPEFGSEAPRQVARTRLGSSGNQVLISTEQGQRSVDASRAALTRVAPSFGEWLHLLVEDDAGRETGAMRMPPADDPLAQLAALSGQEVMWRMKPVLPGDGSGSRLVERFPPPLGVATKPATGPNWSPPRPMQPDARILDLTRPQQEVLLRDERLLVESHRAGLLRLPTGRVVACAPDDYFLAERQPFTVAVPPGNYDLVLRVARGSDELGFDPRVAAAGIAIGEERAVTWELALLPGEDPRLLRDGEAYCFGVDGGTACFMDAAAVHRVAGMYREDDHPLRDGEVAGVRTAGVDEPESGANVLAFESGWGDGCYPVWIGRTESGDVVSFVADMRLFA
ncbi:DUF4241 domain-containing protein [Actinophytocola sp.]|uniref:DUF4241 domain-containing protein n=1 Tax=Actinophytocola sp. TaxID=1872138 RepID=UPI00389B03B2